MNIELPRHDFSTGELDNDDRAEMVRPLLDAFRQTYYGTLWSNEPLDQVLADMMCDLMHLADRVKNEDGEQMSAEVIVDHAWRHYGEEVNGE